MAEIGLGALGHGAGGNCFLLQGPKIIAVFPVSFMCSHPLLQRVVSMITAQSLLQTSVNPLGITTYSLGVEPTNTKSGSSQACQQFRLWK